VWLEGLTKRKLEDNGQTSLVFIFKNRLFCLRLLKFTPLDDVCYFDSYEQLLDRSKSCLFTDQM
jgi:hypothetical protein